jgi:two-component system sensor histidine kinase YesM
MQADIFRSYAIVSVFTFALFAAFVLAYVFDGLKESTYSMLSAVTESCLNSVDSEIESMDTLALNVLYSKVTREEFANHFPDEGSFEDLQRARNVSEMMVSLSAPSFRIPEVMLHDFYGRSITTRNNKYLQVDIQQMDWYDQALARKGQMYITAPYGGMDESMSSDKITLEPLISLFRGCYDYLNAQKGIVEIRQYHSRIFSGLRKQMKSQDHTSIYVYDSGGQVIYPFPIENEDSTIESYWTSIADAPSVDMDSVTLAEISNGSSVDLIASKTSALSGWTFAVVVPRDTIMQKVYDYILLISVMALLILVSILIISYVIARKISRPISMLRKKIDSLNIHSLEETRDEFEIITNGFSEIEEVEIALEKMNAKLNKSVENLFLAQQKEFQALLTALQAQMKPHFILNTLASVSALAEEKRDAEIINICKHLANMLRYVVYNQCEHIVSLKDEFTHTEDYLKCMKIRYDYLLSYNISLSEQVSDVRIPRLSVQPLVENSLKACGGTGKPISIAVDAQESSGGWVVTVEDNGPGFTDESIKTVMASINDPDFKPDSETKGMGLPNLYYRLHLLYGEKLIFKIKKADQGAIVTIGCSQIERNRLQND